MFLGRLVFVSALSLAGALVLASAVQAQGLARGNVPPTADAGADQLVSAGSLVTLDGSRSNDLEGASLNYSWRQIDGPPVVLASSLSSTPSFTSGGSGEVYLFTLTVRDDQGAVGTDRVVVATRSTAANPLAARTVPEAPGPFSDWLGIVRRSLQLMNIFLFSLALLATLLTILERVPRFMAATGRTLPIGQYIGRRFRRGSWLILISGALLNSGLLWWLVAWPYFFLGFAYALFLAVKVLLEMRLRPSHGLVRDAITHVPVDLAVVRLYDEASGRLVLTRATDDHGRFFALPPAGTYRVEILKQGYAPFIREHVSVAGGPDAAVYLKAMLLPSAPHGVAPAVPEPAGFASPVARWPRNQV
jgi:hypothetical protein